MNWANSWNSTTAYSPGTTVYSSSNTYVCLVANTNSQPPSANWKKLSQAVQENGQLFVAGTSLTAGQPVIPAQDGTISLATTGTPIGIVTKNLNSGDSGQVIFNGYVSNSAWNFTSDAPVFVDSTGALVQTVPTDIIREIGIAVSATAMIVCIQKPITL